MKVLVCGPRVWTERGPIERLLRKFPSGTIIVHGAARGADSLAGLAAKALGFEVRPYPVDNALDGPWPAAGVRRNERMLRSEHPCELDGCFVDIGIALKLTPTLSTGTAHMARIMRAADTVIRVHEVLYEAGRLTVDRREPRP